MSYPTRQAAINSLREFSPWLREQHEIVAFYSERHKCTRYARVIVSRGETVSSGV
jgi:hypothetical protein